jgi:hypothetical protein
MSGRALFKFDPTMFKDDDDAADANYYEIREDEEGEQEGEEGKEEELPT